MSVKIMGLVWDLDLPANEKFVLLAYADHANHDGSNIYPAVDSIARKCGYTGRNIQLITRSLEAKGLLIADGKGRQGTNKWRFGGEIFSPVNISGVKSATKGGEIATGKGVNPTSPEPSLTIKEQPSVKEAPKAKPPTPIEVYLFREVTERFPPKVNFQDVVDSVSKIRERLQRAVTSEDLKPFYAAWCHKGYKPINLSWLEWAETGEVPANGNWKPRANEPKGFDAIRQWASKQEELKNVI